MDSSEIVTSAQSPRPAMISTSAHINIVISVSCQPGREWPQRGLINFNIDLLNYALAFNIILFTLYRTVLFITGDGIHCLPACSHVLGNADSISIFCLPPCLLYFINTACINKLFPRLVSTV